MKSIVLAKAIASIGFLKKINCFHNTYFSLFINTDYRKDDNFRYYFIALLSFWLMYRPVDSNFKLNFSTQIFYDEPKLISFLIGFLR